MSEFELIARYFTRPAPGGMLGVGDDCALFDVPSGCRVACSTDLLIEGRHFFSNADPQDLGHKALAVNLSDLAAMGAQPIGCLLGLALRHADAAWLSAFARGFHALADLHGCALIGGDTTRTSDSLAISVTVFGAVPVRGALLRAAAQPGDDIWVSGELGAADIAWRLLDGQLPADAARLAATRQALERPVPRIELGLALRNLAHAAIDLSDGLLQDLGHVLVASGAGARIDYGALPVHPGLMQLPEAPRRRALLGGGDVYELCFTAAPESRASILAAGRACGVRVTAIGQVTAQPGLRVMDISGRAMDNLPAGFNHFH